MHESVREEEINGLRSEAYVSSLAPREVLDTSRLLWGTGRLVRAVVGGFSFVSLEGRATGGAVAGEEDGLGIAGTLLGDDADDLRDDLTALLYEDLIIDVQVEGFDEVSVVKRGTAHGRARERHGIEIGHRRDGTRTPDLEVYGDETRLSLLGLILVGDSPARGLRRIAQLLLLGDGVDLEHDTIGGDGGFGTCLLPVVEEG